MTTQPIDTNTLSPRRRRRSVTEQNFLLRHSHEIHDQAELVAATFFERLQKIKTPQLLKNVEVGLPLGMSVYTYHIFCSLFLVALCFHPWPCYLLYSFCWFFQIGGFLLCVGTMKRPDYDATRSKYITNKKMYETNGVTILKPLHGVPERLAANLETYFNLRYPTYELLLCIKCRKGCFVG